MQVDTPHPPSSPVAGVGVPVQTFLPASPQLTSKMLLGLETELGGSGVGGV